jgi:Domain of unknown function (DUF4192)
MNFQTPRLTLHTPTDLLAAVPYLLGFHPTDSVVVLGLSGSRVVFSARADLPSPDAPPTDALDLADQLGEVLAGQRVDVSLIIGYGEAATVTRTVLPLRDALRGFGVDVGEVLRTDGKRYWSYLCESVRCCPAEGTPYDVTSTEVAAAATFAGQVALPDRAALQQSIAPVGGAGHDAIEVATERAAHDLAVEADRAANPTASRRRSGVQALVTAVRRYSDGDRLSDAEVGRLTLLLAQTDVRDLCWARVTTAGDRLPAHVDLWRDVTRRARADLIAAPATLLGYAAWRSGEGPLARVAIERALAADPRYSLAHLLGEALDRALPPSLFDEPVAAKRRRPRRKSARTG